MSTIPLTFNEHEIQHTVLGGKKVDGYGRFPLTVILLSRSGTTFRTKNLDMLLGLGFNRIISVELTIDNYYLEDLSKRYPSVCFIVPHKPVTPGDMINLAMARVEDDSALVLWDTVKPATRLFAERVVERVINTGRLVTVPSVTNERNQMVSVRFVPYVNNNMLAFFTESLAPDGIHTAYPFDFMGIYNKDQFVRLGGYDSTITSPYWQLLDFGLRAWLQGYEIRISQQLRLNYESPLQIDDTTANDSELRFFLKNLAPRFLYDHAVISKKQFFSYWRRSGKRVGIAAEDFKEARAWVEAKRYLFKTDAAHLVQNWGKMSHDE